MRVLAIPLPPTAHIGSMVPMCWALRTAGHQVLVVCSAETAGTVRAAGLNAAQMSGSDLPIERLRLDMPGHMFPSIAYYERDGEAGRAVWQRVARTWFEHAQLHLDGYRELARRWRPDLILTDPLSLGGRILGARLGIPVVLHRWGVDPTAGPFEDEARRLAAGVDLDLGLDPALIVDACPASLQVPGAAPARTVRFVPYNGVGTLPGWVPASGGRRRICVCLGGTVLSLAGPGVLHRAVEALAGVGGVEVIVALSETDRRIAGPLPEWVRIVESLPLHLFLETCDLLVHHGGSTTGLTGGWFGLPQLVLPQFFDQFDYGHRLAEAGAGLMLGERAQQSDVDVLRQAVHELLDEPRFAKGASLLRAEMLEAPTYATVMAGFEQDLRWSGH